MTLIIALFIIGILLVIAELILPGGVIGIAGAICLLAGVVLTFKDYGTGAGMTAFLGVSIFGLVIIGLWMKNFRKLPVTRSLVLDEAIDDRSEETSLAELIGKLGTAVTDIAPSGHAIVDDEKLDVMTETGTIEKGSHIKIVETRGPSIFVEKA